MPTVDGVTKMSHATDYNTHTANIVDEFMCKKNKVPFDCPGIDESKFLIQDKMVKDGQRVIGPFYGTNHSRPVYIMLDTKRKRQDPEDPEFLKYLFRHWGREHNCDIPEDVIERVPAFHAALIEHISKNRYPETPFLKCVLRLPPKTLTEATRAVVGPH